MKTAVLMSTYNGEKFLRQQIESILNQVCTCQVDLWVRDDGSTDRTHDILNEYALAGKLQWYTGQNLKPAKSFLDLVCHCPGYDFYAFADQDDCWYPDKLQNGINRLNGISVPAISCANARLVDRELRTLGRSVYRNPPHADFYSVTCSGGIMGCTMVFNQELAKIIRAKPVPQKLIMHDYYLCIVCTLCDGIIVYDPEPCMDYRQHGGNVVGSSSSRIGAVKNRIQRLTNRSVNTLDDMAAIICENYPDVSNQNKLEWLKGVSRYRESLFRALKLALDTKPTYNSFNMMLTLRIQILLRNR